MGILTSSIIGLILAMTNNTLRNRVLGKERGRLGWRNFLSSLPVFLAPFMFGPGFGWAAVASAALFAVPLIVNAVSSVRKFNKIRKEKRGEKVNALLEANKAVKQKEKSISRAEGWRERLNKAKGWKIFSGVVLGGALTWLIAKNSSRLSNLNTSIQDLYLQKGARELAVKNIKSVADKYISFSEVTLPDGSKRYEVGRDLNPTQIAEIREALISKFGVNANDPKVLTVSRFTNSDLASMFGTDREAKYYDRKNGTFHSVGASVSDLKVSYGKGSKAAVLSVAEYVEKANEAMKTKGLSNFKDIMKEGFPGGLHMSVLGNSAVALIMDGVVMAHAVAGEDGKIRLRGNDGMHGTGEQKRLVSKLNEKFRDVGTIQEWCDMAKNIILQPENIKSINNGFLNKKNTLSASKERKNLQKKIINAPKKAVKALGRAL